MTSPEDQFKINLNQNLWGLIVGLSGLGAAEHFGLSTLFWFSAVTSTIMTISVFATTFSYTINYCKQKSK